MLSTDKLRDLNIFPWEEISEDFQDSDILLGNGFTRNLSNRFNYDSLFEEFLTLYDTEQTNVFQEFESTNFEFILRELQTTVRVNNLFKVDSEGIEESVEMLRNGFISTIESNHPKAADIPEGLMRHLALQFQPFRDIFTLNYDIYLYRIIMSFNDLLKEGVVGHGYRDRFRDRYNSYYTLFNEVQNDPNYYHVYYLHGALFLFTRGYYTSLKIRTHGMQELIEVIRSEMHSSEFPLFVSEGSAAEKRNSISRSYYLEFCLDQLKSLSNSMVIYGTSLSEQDAHIINAIKRRGTQIAYSIYPHNQTKDDLKSIIYNTHANLGGEVLFFDSTTLFNFQIPM
jgi:hypothetical protein